MQKQDELEGLNFPTKKILWLENGEIFGGAEMFSLDMLSHVAENFSESVEIHYCSHELHPNLKNRLEEIQKFLPEHISLHTSELYLPPLRSFSPQNIWNLLVSAKTVRQKITSENFDFVHANTPRTGFILSIAGLLLNTQKSFFSHDYTCPQKWLRFGTKTFQKIFACSYPIKDFIHQAGVEFSDISVIENGVDPEKFSDIFQKTGAGGQYPPLLKFGILGRISSWKGQLTVLKAIENIFEEYGRKTAPLEKDAFGNLEFHFFGEPSKRDEDQEFFIRLQHFVSENTLEKNVFFHGFTDLHKALEKVDAVIHASHEREPFGRTPLEGAICGKPVFISNMGSPAQIFEDQKTAIFFEPKDAEMLSEKIVWAVRNPEKTKKIAAAGKQMVEKNFNLSKISRKFWSWFQG